MKSKDGKIICSMCGKHGNEITHDDFIRKEERERIFELLREKCDAIKFHDKTPRYGYSKKERDRNNYGDLPPMAQRWKTPSELVDDIERILKEAKP